MNETINPAIELQKDFYKSELLKMGYFKTPEGLQLYELSLDQLENIYKKEKLKIGEMSHVKNRIECVI